MKSTVFITLIWSLLFLAACAQQKELESSQSVQDIVSQTPDYEDVTETPVEKPVVKNTTVETPAKNTTQTNHTAALVNESQLQVSDTMPPASKKCRNSAILYGGCKWNDAAHTNFDLKVGSASKIKIASTWLIVTGESGGVLYINRPEDILSLATRTYNINYADLTKQVGTVKRIEILPTETINGTEYVCENMHIYTIPDAYCKPHEPTRINEDGSINQTG